WNDVDANGSTISEMLNDLNCQFPGIRFRMIDEQDSIRPHMKIFVNGEQVWRLDTALESSDEVYILQALSGGCTLSELDGPDLASIEMASFNQAKSTGLSSMNMRCSWSQGRERYAIKSTKSRSVSVCSPAKHSTSASMSSNHSSFSWT